MADDDSSDLSELSSVPSIDSEPEAKPSPPKKGILKFLTKKPKAEPVKEPSPPPRKRSPSPPHEPTLADNPDIAFLVMVRCRFSDCFPKAVPHLGPQDIERDAAETVPGRQTEHFLCGLLGLVLNRKQDVKPGHYNRALEEAISTHKSQWPRSWMDKNPLSGGKTFETLDATERITVLKTLALWSLSSSETVRAAINKSYRVNRHEDDLNQPLSVQPCGSDSDRRRYYLIEGDDDTAFRIYRESNPAGLKRTWRSVAGNIDELRQLAERLVEKDGGPKARQLSGKILSAIPRFEASEEKRRRREYRQMRKAIFKRPDPGFSLYEGRTRGKRIRYTYDDNDDFESDSTGTRRSTRGTGTHTPAEHVGPVTTLRGRQIRAPVRMDGVASTRSNTNSVQGDDVDDFDVSMVSSTGRPRRAAAMRNGAAGESLGASRTFGASEETESNSEPDYGDDEEDDDADADVNERALEEEEDDKDEYDEDEAMVDDDLDEAPPPKLTVKRGSRRSATPSDAVSNENQRPFDPSSTSLAYRASPEKAHLMVQ